MSFRFFHAADIHLDSPLRGLASLADSRGQPFIDATRRALENLVAATISHEAKFLIIAGDLFDGEWRDYRTGLFFAEQMGVLRRHNIRGPLDLRAKSRGRNRL